MDVVLPISIKRRKGEKSDLHRLQILCASMRKFWRGGGTFHVITPDVDAVSAELARLDYEAHVLHDDAVFDRIPEKLHPWWRQQLLKLAVHRIVGSDFYLVLDADCFFVKETFEHDLVIEGRGRVAYGESPAYSHKSWYRGCHKLGLPVPEKHVNVTPFVMNRSLAKTAFEFIQDRPETIGKLGWSEYTLYHCVSEQDGTWDEKHIETEHFLGNSVWLAEDLGAWDPELSFNKPFHMSLVQSNTGVSATDVWHRLRNRLMLE